MTFETHCIVSYLPIEDKIGAIRDLLTFWVHINVVILIPTYIFQYYITLDTSHSKDLKVTSECCNTHTSQIITISSYLSYTRIIFEQVIDHHLHVLNSQIFDRFITGYINKLVGKSSIIIFRICLKLKLSFDHFTFCVKKLVGWGSPMTIDTKITDTQTMCTWEPSPLSLISRISYHIRSETSKK